MTCPDDVAAILLRILETAILRARARGGAGDAKACWSEMDHVHNLPSLLADFSWDRLRYYTDAERPGFLRRGPGPVESFRRDWEELDALLARAPETATA